MNGFGKYKKDDSVFLCQVIVRTWKYYCFTIGIGTMFTQWNFGLLHLLASILNITKKNTNLIYNHEWIFIVIYKALAIAIRTIAIAIAIAIVAKKAIEYCNMQ